MNNKFVFPKWERNRFVLSFIAIICFNICFTIFTLYKYMIYRDGSVFYGCIIICIVFSAVLVSELKYVKYRFSKYIFNSESISLFYKNEFNKISRYDNFNISVLTLYYGDRYIPKPEKFIVLSKCNLTDIVIHNDKVSPYIAMRKYKAIVLPYEQEFLNGVESSLGINCIPEHQSGDGSMIYKKYNTGDGSVCSDEK